jgi:hypothetical protein
MAQVVISNVNETTARKQTDAMDALHAVLNMTDETLTKEFDELLSKGITLRGLNLV